jgi:hypothetical protein
MIRKYVLWAIVVGAQLWGMNGAANDTPSAKKPDAPPAVEEKHAATKEVDNVLRDVESIQAAAQKIEPGKPSPLTGLCRPRKGTVPQIAECLMDALNEHYDELLAELGNIGYSRLVALTSKIYPPAAKEPEKPLDGDAYWAAVSQTLVSEKPSSSSPREEVLAYYIFVKLVETELKATEAGANYLSEVSALSASYVDYQFDQELFFNGIKASLRKPATETTADNLAQNMGEVLLISGMMGLDRVFAVQLLEDATRLFDEKFAIHMSTSLNILYQRTLYAAVRRPEFYTSKGLRYALSAIVQAYAKCPHEDGTLRELSLLFDHVSGGNRTDKYRVKNLKIEIASVFDDLTKADAGLKKTADATPAYRAILLYAARSRDFNTNVETQLKQLVLPKK